MCGIFGVWGKSIDKKLVKKATDSMMHRGPDQSGYHFDKEIALGHRRLSIIDLSEKGRQPMSNEEGTVWITFNGEIFNHQEVRAGLKKKHTFHSHTDTEVIIHAYEEEGISCVKKFNGFFAFALWDSTKKRLFLVRDRLGIKPVYYSAGEGMVFSSELRAFKAYGMALPIDPAAITSFLNYQYIPSHPTAFSHIKKLPPACYLEYDGKNSSLYSYWDVMYGSSGGIEENSKKLLELLDDSVEKRLMSDVPLGAFLSGGLDSSLIVALMHKHIKDRLKTFSVGFSEKGYDESIYSQSVADYLGTEHHHLHLETLQPEQMQEVGKSLDDPIADPAAVPTYYLSRMAKKHVSVALTGEGSDEIFAGYTHHRKQKIAHAFNIIPRPLRSLAYETAYYGKALAPVLIRLEDTLWSASQPEDIRNPSWTMAFKGHESKHIVPEQHLAYLDEMTKPFAESYHHQQTSYLNKSLYTDLKIWLNNNMLLVKDKVSMAHALELRVPFLDHRIVEFAASIPVDQKLHGKTGKYILRKTASGLVPQEIIDRKKHGFDVPIGTYLRSSLKSSFEELHEQNNGTFVRKEHVEKLWKLLQKGHDRYARQMWVVMNLYLWQDIHGTVEGK